MSIKYLSLDQILIIHEMMISKHGGSHGVRDRALLESALMRPQLSFGGSDLYPSLYTKAAALMHSLVKNHPFVDGNKRTGTNAAVTFLDYNKVFVKVEYSLLVELAVDVAQDKYSVKELAAWFEESSK